MEFLNCLQLQYNWDNDELEDSEGLMKDLTHLDLPAQFPDIELDSKNNDGATLAMMILEASTEQKAHEAVVNNRGVICHRDICDRCYYY